MSGAHAEYLRVPEKNEMAHIPEGMDCATACSAGYGAGTSLLFLRDLAKLKAGERLLVVGGSGGVGLPSIQIAKHMGAEVTAVCSKPNVDACKAAGADHTVDYNSTDFHRSGQKYDVIFDLSDKTTFGRCKHLLLPGGRFATVYLSLGILLWMAWTALSRGSRALFTIALPSKEDFTTLSQLMGEGVAHPVVAHTFPLSAVQQAYHVQETTNTPGAVVLNVAPEPEHTHARSGN